MLCHRRHLRILQNDASVLIAAFDHTAICSKLADDHMLSRSMRSQILAELAASAAAHFNVAQPWVVADRLHTFMKVLMLHLNSLTVNMNIPDGAVCLHAVYLALCPLLLSGSSNDATLHLTGDAMHVGCWMQ